MSTILITSAKLVLPSHKFHNQQVDVLLKNGLVEAIGANLVAPSKTTQTWDAKGCDLSVGFFDLHTNIGEPGFETPEEARFRAADACAGGFTASAVHPNTHPAVHSRAQISLLINAAQGNLVDVQPVGAVSKKREGKD